MAYQTGTINNIAELVTAVDSFLTTNGWTKVAQSASLGSSSVSNLTANTPGSLSISSTISDVLPIGAKLSIPDIPSANVYVIDKGSANLIVVSNVNVTSGARTITASWDSYTKGSVNINFSPLTILNSAKSYEHLVFDINTLANSGKSYAVSSANGTRWAGSSIALNVTNGEFPATYHIFGNSSPDTISIVVSTGVNRTEWVCFGTLSKVHSSAYVGGEFLVGSSQAVNQALYPLVSISDGSILTTPGGNWQSGCIFSLNSTSAIVSNGLLRCNIDGTEWGSNKKVQQTVLSISRWFRGLNQWNQQALLGVVELEFIALSGFTSYLGYLTHVRNIRIDNYNNNDTITIGSDQWKVFSVGLKNLATRNGNVTSSSTTSHTGTLGLAFKYTP